MRLPLILLAAVVAASLAGQKSAAAADLLVKSPLYTQAPVTAPTFSWQRCYVGGHVGYGWGRSTNDFGAQFNPPIFDFNLSTSGWLGGAQAGCNWKVAKTLIVGVEGEIWLSGLTGSRLVNFGLFDIASVNFTAKNRWDADLALRVGMPFDKVLIYLKGGLAYGSFSYNWVQAGVPFGATAGKWGWLLGIGVEYAVADNWSVKLEYNHIDYGTGSVLDPAWQFGAFNTRETKDIVKVGVNYLFGGPVVAKY
jgi:outer membrane immunogenic protein